MEHWWNDVGKGQQQYGPGACHFIHRRLHMALPVIEVLQTAKLQFG
jgi:hypothetical protein